MVELQLRHVRLATRGKIRNHHVTGCVSHSSEHVSMKKISNGHDLVCKEDQKCDICASVKTLKYENKSEIDSVHGKADNSVVCTSKEEAELVADYER